MSGPATSGGAAQGRSAGRNFDLVVAGGGVTATAMASLAVARKLAAPGRVAVLAEWLPPPDARAASEAEWDLRVFAMSRASQRMLSLCGAWQHLPPSRLCAYERMCVWEAGDREAQRRSPGAAGSLCFDSAELGEPNLGFIVEGRALQIASRRAAGAAGVIFIEAGIDGIEADRSGARIRLRDGRDLQAGLLIAADGAESPVRGLLGIETAGHAYHQDALVAHVRTEKPHLATARQRFLPTGPLAFLPLPDGRSSIVWSAVRAAGSFFCAPHLCPDLHHQLLVAIGQFHGRWRDVGHLVTGDCAGVLHNPSVVGTRAVKKRERALGVAHRADE